MSIERLTNSYLVAVKEASGGDTVSALFRTRSAEQDGKLGEQQKRRNRKAIPRIRAVQALYKESEDVRPAPA
jgi:hypothetical protein